MENQLANKAGQSPNQAEAFCTGKPAARRSNSPFVHLQRVAGNQFVGRMLQAKLKIGAANDRYEKEADQVADRVVRMADPVAPGGVANRQVDAPEIQRVCSGCEEELRRQPTDEECEEELRRSPKDEDDNLLAAGGATAQTPITSPSVESRINNLRGAGDPLPGSMRAFFEPRFEQDFNQVRIHTDGEAAATAKAINAAAYTVGHDIAFAEGMYSPESESGRRLLAHELTHVVQQGHSMATDASAVRRQSAEANMAIPAAPTQEGGPGAEGTERSALIVEDDARQVESGQMRRSEFLARLKEDVCRESDDAMRVTGQTTEGCPYVERWFDYYSDKPSSYIERALRRYAPEAASATSATDYIRAASARVRRSVEVWATTGEITGVPDELASVVMGGAILGAIGGVIGGIASAIGGVVSGIGRAITGLGRLLFKGREGGARQGAEAGQVSESLNGGESLEGGVRQRMEGAFGRDFSGVRVHRDGQAAAMTDGMNARALTIGKEIAFGGGEYQPGTMIGDALIAHELAHVIQQGDVATSGGPMLKGETGHDVLEEEADTSAVAAMVKLWGGAVGGIADLGKNAIPRLRSGLRLQRCPRRTEPVTQREADVFIRGEFGSNVAGAIAAGISAERADFRLVDEARFARAYLCGQRYMVQQGKHVANTPVQRVIAFVDPRPLTPRRVYICNTRMKPDTVIHEALHLYTNATWSAEMHWEIDEGATEYFTRRIADSQRISIYEAYQCNYRAIATLVGVINEAPLRRAYFEGDIDGLKSAINRGRPNDTYNNWWLKVALAEYESAREVLGLSRETEC